MGPARVPPASRFLGEIPASLIEWRRDEAHRRRAGLASALAQRPGVRSPGNRRGAVAVARRPGHARHVRARHGDVGGGRGDDAEANIDFGGDYGVKHLLLRYAPIDKL